MRTTLIQAITSTHEARENCKRSGNAEWSAKHAEVLRHLCTFLPSGSGIDNGTTVVEIDERRVKLSCSFHHMTEGSYDGWTEHTIRVVPSWQGIEVKVTGRNCDDIIEYLHDVYYCALTAEVYADAAGTYHLAPPQEAK